MRVWLGGQWKDGYPDLHRAADDYRVRVLMLQNLESVEGLYFVRKRSLRTVWNYLREIGPADVLRKVRSRTRERGRNEKLVSCGIGRIVDAPLGGRYDAGDLVAFLLPIGPPCLERVVVPEELMLGVHHAELPAFREDAILYRAEQPDVAEAGRWWEIVRAWTAHSGNYLPPVAAEMALKESLELVRRTDWSDAASLPADLASGSTSIGQRLLGGGAGDRKRAVLFGYGNYAKTTLLPTIEKHLDVDCVHEIDPTQIPDAERGKRVWDSSPVATPLDDQDVFLIAGYHHTHAPLAAEALRRGAAAVIEKPIATTRRQLRDLLAAMDETGGPVFSCFQRRYSPFNDMAREDLGVADGDPISYHCIVYEVPLPELHWYRWANSRSRLVSNGCHWIDHFLFLNGYGEVESYDVTAAPDGTVNCSVTLANGAFFTMVLTDRGSERIGVQDHVELRAGGATVTIVNASRYQAESGDRVLRRKRINRLLPYRRMYEAIGERIAAGLPGDSRRAVQLTASLVLDLEQRLQQEPRLQERRALGVPTPAAVPRVVRVATAA